jgi:hypothetical protein
MASGNGCQTPLQVTALKRLSFLPNKLIRTTARFEASWDARRCRKAVTLHAYLYTTRQKLRAAEKRTSVI